MRQVLAFLAALLFSSGLFSQTPQKMSYQAVIRNSSGELVTNKMVGMQISILQGSASGSVVYTETQVPTANDNGLVSVEIGGGTGFDNIDWTSGPYFIKIETDPLGGTNYTIEGTSQLLSVPYALHAKTAESISGGISESDPVFGISPASGILAGNISNWDQAFGWGNHASAGYLKNFTETDPIFGTSPANGITLSNITDWTSAYNWGNHATAGYLKSYTETDPVFAAAPAKNITGTNITNWNTAYSWGDHATAGYLKSFTETDPKVGANTTGYSPKWDGSALVKGSVYQDASGNVGIGTASPSVKFNVIGTSIIQGPLSINTSNSPGTSLDIYGSQARIYSGASTVNFGIHNTNGRDWRIESFDNSGLFGAPIGAMAFLNNTDNVRAMVILPSGNIGIGKLGATTKLDVNGDITATGGNSTNWNTAYAWGNHASAGYLTSFTETDPEVGTNTSGYSPKWDGSALVTGAIYQDATGKVGVGTVSPTEKLEVSGNILSTSGIIYSGAFGAITSTGAGNSTSIKAGRAGGGLGASLQSSGGGLNGGNISIEGGSANHFAKGGDITLIAGDAFDTGSQGGNVLIKSGGYTNWTPGYIAFFTPGSYPFGMGNPVEKMRIAGNGNIGIGTSVPTTTLEVNGIITATAGNSTNWNTAYGWGNHATAGYLTSEVDGSVTNEIQTLSLSNDSVYLSNGGVIKLPPSNSWSLNGNAGTVDGTNFIGTTDNIPLNIKVNNQKSGRIDSNGPTFFGYQAGKVDNGISNTGFGYQALSSNTTGPSNSAIGSGALQQNTGGGWNAASGSQSLQSNTTGGWNNANGTQSMMSNTTGNWNNANGTAALRSNTIGSNNTSTGSNALWSNIAGSNGTAIGYNAMLNAYNGSAPFINYNVAVGYEALKGSANPAANTGNFNSAFGYQVLNKNTTGSSNTSLGIWSMAENTTGNSNVAIGYDALLYNSSGNENTASGDRSLHFNTSGSYNTAYGVHSLLHNTTGNYNTGLGYDAGSSNSAGSNNVFLGYQAGFNETGSNKLYIANSSVNPPLIYGDFSAGRVGIGTISPSYKFEVSEDALINGVRIGRGSGNLVNNTAVGNGSLSSNTNGSANSAYGMNSLSSNTTGWHNSAFGIYSMEDNSDGSYNTVMGSYSYRNNTSGNFNTIIGSQAGENNITGSRNVFIGYAAGYSETGSNKLYIANDYVNPPLIYGDFSAGNVGIGTTNPGAKLEVNGDVIVRGNLYAPGTVVQTIVKTSEVTSSLNVTSFTEADADYRISITPKYANSIILVEYNFPINTALQSNTIIHMQLIRDIGGAEIPVGVGPVNGSRDRTTYVSRPNNGTDSNDMQNVYMIAKDNGLTAGTTYIYGFKYRRETGGSGTCYFNYNNVDTDIYGFSGIMTIKATEIAQ